MENNPRLKLENLELAASLKRLAKIEAVEIRMIYQ